MSLFGLIDANNFYVSCERLFKPNLENKPVAVLSNNDGNVVSRSNELKKIGVPMAAPYYQLKKLFQQHDVKVFSSNYKLYGELSERVMKTLAMFMPQLEIYSIDEAFVDLSGIPEEKAFQHCIDVRQIIKMWLGIPVSIGIAPTKTLAKIANHLAKKYTIDGVFVLNANNQNEILSNFSVANIWGIGRQYAKKLEKFGITTAKQLRDTDTKFIRKHFTVIGERMVYELRGLSRLSLEAIQNKKSISCTRSFGRLLTEFSDIADALSQFVAQAAEKARKQHSKVKAMQVFLQTNPFRQDLAQYYNCKTYHFLVPTNNTPELITAAKCCLNAIYKSGYQFQKTGIIFVELQNEKVVQHHLFLESKDEKSEKLMQTVDLINNRYGKNKIFFAAQGISGTWSTKYDYLSPSYMHDWEELPIVKCQ